MTCLLRRYCAFLALRQRSCSSLMAGISICAHSVGQQEATRRPLSLPPSRSCIMVRPALRGRRAGVEGKVLACHRIMRSIVLEMGVVAQAPRGARLAGLVAGPRPRRALSEDDAWTALLVPVRRSRDMVFRHCAPPVKCWSHAASAQSGPGSYAAWSRRGILTAKTARNSQAMKGDLQRRRDTGPPLCGSRAAAGWR